MPPKVLQDNLGVDLVIKYKIPSFGIYDITSNFQKLIRTLAEIHLETEVRAADDSSLFIFVKAGNNEAFTDVIYRSRIRDWLHGVRQIQPTREAVSTLTETPLSESERLRMIHAMITSQRMDGGANITPKHGEWKNVEAIFPLHNDERNKKWLADFTKKTFLTPEDLDHVRDAVGEKVSTEPQFAGIILTADRLHTTMLSSSPISNSLHSQLHLERLSGFYSATSHLSI